MFENLPRGLRKKLKSTWMVNTLVVTWKTFILNLSHVTGGNLLGMCHCACMHMEMCTWQGGMGELRREEEKTAALHNRAWIWKQRWRWRKVSEDYVQHEHIQKNAQYETPISRLLSLLSLLMWVHITKMQLVFKVPNFNFSV